MSLDRNTKWWRAKGEVSSKVANYEPSNFSTTYDVRPIRVLLYFSLFPLFPLLPPSFIFLYLSYYSIRALAFRVRIEQSFQSLIATVYVPRSRMRYWNARSAKKSFSDRYRRKWWYIYVTDVYDPFVICRLHASWIKGA